MTLILDDRRTGDIRSTFGPSWRLITDTVMGGVSLGELKTGTVDGRSCLRLRGNVSLENNGGFIQAALDLRSNSDLDASAFAGIMLQVYGNDEEYNLHVRTADVSMPWQSYRTSITAIPRWQTFFLPFEMFRPHRITIPFDARRLCRIGLVAIGRCFTADLCLGALALYESGNK